MAEYCILEALVLQPKQTVLRSILLGRLERIHKHVLHDNTLSVHIRRLRKVLGGNNCIKTRHSLGYYWACTVEKAMKIDTF